MYDLGAGWLDVLNLLGVLTSVWLSAVFAPLKTLDNGTARFRYAVAEDGRCDL